MSGFVLFDKMTKVLEYGYIALRQFPKTDKYVLAADLREQMFNVLRFIVRANKAKEGRLELVQDLDVELDVLRIQIELARDLKFLPFRKYGIWIKKVDEVGRLIGGWLRSL